MPQPTTQDQIPIEDISNNIIIQKDGSCSLILETSAINFGLLSDEEQDASIYAYAAFLNSLTFSIQILIRSNVKDISNYLRLLDEQVVKQPNPIKKQNIASYKQFISSLITERNVLEKKFYISIPFSTLELGVTESFTSSLKLKRQKSGLPFEKSYIIEKARLNLEPKRDHIIRQLGRVGLSARELATKELIQLVFSMYNPSSGQGQKISNTADYQTPLVQPALINSLGEAMSDAPTNNQFPATNQPTVPQPSTQPDPAIPNPPSQDSPPPTPTPDPTSPQPQPTSPLPSPTEPQPPSPSPTPPLNPPESQVPPSSPTPPQTTTPPTPNLDPSSNQPQAEINAAVGNIAPPNPQEV